MGDVIAQVDKVTAGLQGLVYAMAGLAIVAFACRTLIHAEWRWGEFISIVFAVIAASQIDVIIKFFSAAGAVAGGGAS